MLYKTKRISRQLTYRQLAYSKPSNCYAINHVILSGGVLVNAWTFNSSSSLCRSVFYILRSEGSMHGQQFLMVSDIHISLYETHCEHANFDTHIRRPKPKLVYKFDVRMCSKQRQTEP